MLLTYKNYEDFISIIRKEKCNALIFGCGIENNQKNKNILTFLLKQNVGLVLDAVVFSLFQKNKNELLHLLNKRTNKTIMTPHAGEFKRVFNTSNNKINDYFSSILIVFIIV